MARKKRATSAALPAHSWPVTGHDWAVDYLRKGMLNDRIRHAYLLAGTPAIGKMTLAKSFAMALNCTADDPAQRPCGTCRNCKRIISGSHMDVIYSSTDETSGQLKIDTIRAITSQIAMKPYEGRYRVAIMDDFDRAQPRAQDALLKTLEEPPPYAVLILITTALEPILPTITSRSQVVYLRPVAAHVTQAALQDKYGLNDDDARLLARFSGGRIGWAIQAAQDPTLLDQRESALDLLEQVLQSNRAQRFELANDLGKDKLALGTLLELWQTYWRDLMLQTQSASVRLANVDREVSLQQMTYAFNGDDVLRALNATRALSHILSYNINTRLALETLFLEYPGLAYE
jgi:DNA polymerase III subunit delta'